jgi:hypothetical protein
MPLTQLKARDRREQDSGRQGQAPADIRLRCRSDWLVVSRPRQTAQYDGIDQEIPSRRCGKGARQVFGIEWLIVDERGDDFTIGVHSVL